jgi:hypothetical protein
MADGHSTAGKSIIEMLWANADAKYARLRELHAETYGGITAENIRAWFDDNTHDEDVVAYLQTQGQLQGLCYALGRMLHMYDPPKDAMEKIKAELRERWAAENEEEE